MSDNLNQNSSVEFKPHPQIEDHTMPGFKYYHSGTTNFKMIRKDGKNIVFNQHFFESDQSGDIDYLDEEIQHRNIHLRYATSDEIRAAHYRRDPKAVIMEDVKNDESFMEELRAQVRAQLLAEGGFGGQQNQLPEPIKHDEKVIETSTAKVTLDSKLDSLKDKLSAGHQPNPLGAQTTADLGGNKSDSTQK